MGFVDRLFEKLGLIYPYKKEFIIESKNKRLEIIRGISGNKVMLFNGITYSRMPNDSIYTGSYWDFFLPLAYLYKNPKILMIGLGGGTIAYQLDSLFSSKINLDIVEIDKDVVEIAKKFYPGIKTNIIIEDGVNFVKGKKGYDAIILDAYNNLDIPEGFMSEDFINDAYDALNAEGILAINLTGGMAQKMRFLSYNKLLLKRFKQLFVVKGGRAMNLIELCSKDIGKEEIIKRLKSNMKIDNENKHIFEGYKKMSKNIFQI